MDILDFVNLIDELDVEYMETVRDNTINRVRINPFEQYDDDQFKKKYRFSKAFAHKLLDLVVDDLPSDVRGNTIKPEIQAACALRHWARHQIQDDSGDMQGISQQLVSKIAKNIAQALARKAHLFINMPTTLEEQQESMRGFRSICNFLTD